MSERTVGPTGSTWELVKLQTLVLSRQGARSSWISSRGLWIAQAAFALALSAIYLPGVIFVYGVMADAEQIFFKSDGFIGHEAWHLARIGRPIGALFVNIPLLFLDHLSDFRYARLFSLLTIIVVGCMMIRILVRRLWIRPVIAMIIATGILCLPGFIFSVMNPTAWSMHLLSLVLGVGAYALLARSHASSLFLSNSVRALNYSGVWQNYFAPGRRGAVAMALLLFQLGMFCYPPNCLVILIFPIATLLFSPIPVPCRESIFLRDLGFVAAGVVLYVATLKLVYFPIGHALELLAAVPDTGPASIYRFVFDFNLIDVLRRLLDSLRVAKDLWFLPNFGGFILAGYAALAAGLVLTGVIRRPLQAGAMKTGSLAIVAIGMCYVLSVAPLIFSVGGLIPYRTVVAPSAIVLLVVLYVAGRICASPVARFAPRRAWTAPDLPYVLPMLVAIFWTTSYGICTVIQICQNELVYVASAVRDASLKGADGLVVLDGRKMISPDEVWLSHDIQGRALVPYESGCFSTYCIGAPGIYAVAKEELRLPKNSIDVLILRNEVLKGATCESLHKNMLEFGTVRGWPTRNPSEIELRDFLAQNAKVECREYDTKWLDLGWHADSGFLKSSSRIDRSVWKIFLPKPM